jgi:hypothetical protein
VDEPDPKADCLIYRTQFDGLTSHQDFTFVRNNKSTQDLHQGGLAGSVLSNKRYNFPLKDFQGNSAECGDTGIPFYGTPDFNEGLRVGQV